jgi:hypothetical protein
MASTARNPITLKPIVWATTGMGRVHTHADIEYASSPVGALTLDIYRPPRTGDALPVVVLVTGYPDAGVRTPLGCAFKETAAVTSTARLLAASKLAAVAYTTSDPVADAPRALEHLAHHADELEIDPSRMALWATSGNVPVALGLLTARRPSIRAAVLLNGFMFETEGLVEAAARSYRFVNPIADSVTADLPASVPLFIVRSGRDGFAGVNASIDRFVADAIALNLPLTFVNHASAPHAFEINHDSDISRAVLAQAVSFLRLHLSAEDRDEGGNGHGHTEQRR